MAGSDEILYAWKKGSAWNTAVAVGANNGFLGLPATIKAIPEKLVDNSLGQPFPTGADPGPIDCTVDMPSYGRYNDIVRLSQLAQFMGTAGTPATHQGGTTSKDHALKWSANIDGKFGTFCAKMGTIGIQEVPSLKPNKIVMKWETGKPMEMTISGIGTDEVTNSAVNTSFSSVTIPAASLVNRIYTLQTELRMNAQSAIALASGDKKGYSSIEITLERTLKGFTGSYTSGDAVPRDVTDEPNNAPGDEGSWKASIKITFPRATDFTGWADVRAITPMKAEIICTGPIIEGAIPYLFKVQLPHLSPRTSETPHVRGILGNTREYDIFGATAAPAGMTGLTDPIWILLTNTISTDLLA